MKDTEEKVEVLDNTENNKKLQVLPFIFIFLGIAILFLLYFLWPKPKDVTISFDSKGGTPVEDIVVKEGSTIKLPETEKTGYTFAGWYWNDVKLEKEIKVKEDRLLIAKWVLSPKTDPEPIVYEIKFNTDGGTGIENLKLECGKPLSLPTPPEKDRYIFKGWRNKFGVEVKEGDYPACEDQEFTAIWEKKIEYYCQTGYTLSGSKCKMTMEPKKHCREEELDIGNEMCLRDYQEADKCGSKVIEYRDGRVEKTSGVYIPAVDSCFYGEESSYVEETCISTFGEGHFEDNTCYVEKDEIQNICPNEHVYFTEEQLKKKTNKEKVRAGCYELMGYASFCEEEGYQLENDTCVKTVNALVR